MHLVTTGIVVELVLAKMVQAVINTGCARKDILGAVIKGRGSVLFINWAQRRFIRCGRLLRVTKAVPVVARRLVAVDLNKLIDGVVLILLIAT